MPNLSVRLVAKKECLLTLCGVIKEDHPRDTHVVTLEDRHPDWELQTALVFTMRE